MMKLLNKLNNPFLLAANGFILGTLLFGAMTSPEPSAAPVAQDVSAYEIPAA